MLPNGGTLAVNLGQHALKRGYKATLFTYNLRLFDPTWFNADSYDLVERLSVQAKAKSDPTLLTATRAYITYLEMGGKIRFEDLDRHLIETHLERGIPLLVGLSATYLHRTMRERPWDDDYDDIHGTPAGHFVVLAGFDDHTKKIHVADPLFQTDGENGGKFTVAVERLIGAIFLGVLTYDGNLLVIEPNS